ncbi:MAG: hypothetical protein LBT13_02935 [Treponema sp.]|jgi:ABC-type Zn uptake system ZnuABC Zn-binding protein ZnuA|nr:hypothetical protein [Treponema sp.]
MMKRLVVMTTMILVFGVLLWAGGHRDRGNSSFNGKPKVVATIFPPFDFVCEITGDRVELTNVDHLKEYSNGVHHC